MPGCCALNCHNKYQDGFRLFTFPKNAKRRQVWAENCRKQPSKYSRLCEYHFDDTQFESRRLDGWRKLKPNAIPTIFNFNEANMPQDTIDFSADVVEPDCKEEFESIDELDLKPIVSTSNPVTVTKAVQVDESSNPILSHTRYLPNNYGTIRQSNEIKFLSKNIMAAKKKIALLESKLYKEKLHRLKLSLLMKMLKKKNLAVKKYFEKYPALRMFAKEIENQSVGMKWSLECLHIATQIRCTVGWKGYMYLRKDLGLPLPGYSTLCKHESQYNPVCVRKDSLPLRREIEETAPQTEYILVIDDVEL